MEKNFAASGRVGSASREEGCPVCIICGNAYDAESASSILTCSSCSTGINSVGFSCLYDPSIISSPSSFESLPQSPLVWQEFIEGMCEENIRTMDSDSETDQPLPLVSQFQFEPISSEIMDPNNNAQEAIPTQLVDYIFPILDLSPSISTSQEEEPDTSAFELKVLSNTDTVATSNATDPSAWTKNKYRSVVVHADVGLGKKLYHSSTNFVQGNNKTKKNVEIPTGALELDCYLTDQDDNPLGCLDHCAKLFEVNAPKQIIDLSTSRRFLFKVRMLCLPSYHQAAYFKLHIVVRNSDGDIIAATSVDIPKVHASRSAKRRQ